MLLYTASVHHLVPSEPTMRLLILDVWLLLQSLVTNEVLEERKEEERAACQIHFPNKMVICLILCLIARFPKAVSKVSKSTSAQYFCAIPPFLLVLRCTRQPVVVTTAGRTAENIQPCRESTFLD